MEIDLSFAARGHKITGAVKTFFCIEIINDDEQTLLFNSTKQSYLQRTLHERNC